MGVFAGREKQTRSARRILTMLATALAFGGFQGVHAQAKPAMGVVLSGHVTKGSGSSADSGTLTLRFQADGATEEDWALSSRSWKWTQGPWLGDRTCLTTESTSGSPVEDTGADCLRPIPWFAAWLVDKAVPHGPVQILQKAPDDHTPPGLTKLHFALDYASVLHLNPSQLAGLQALSEIGAMDVVYAPDTGTAQEVDYTQGGSSDPSQRISIAVKYSDFRQVEGLSIPYHIQRYVQNTLNVDFQADSASLQ